jgi:hypothetical protein
MVLDALDHTTEPTDFVLGQCDVQSYAWQQDNSQSSRGTTAPRLYSAAVGHGLYTLQVIAPHHESQHFLQ